MTLNRWLQLGLFTEADGKVNLSSPFDNLDLDTAPEFWPFRHEVRRLVLKDEANTDFLRPEPSGAADFTFVCAWLLSSDVYAGHLKNLDSVQAHERNEVEPIGEGEAKYALQNDTRWPGFRDWAAFLGFGWNASPFQLDPTEAVEFELSDLLKDRKDMTIDTILDHISRRIPVLDGGRFAIRARERATSGWRPIEEHEVSPALSRALLCLEASGKIKLADRSDAAHRTLLGRGFRELCRVSHIEAAKGWS